VVHRTFQSPIQAVEGKPSLYKSYGAIWGDHEHLDAYGTFFTRDTELGLDWFDRRPWLYGHGQNRFAGSQKLGDWKDHGLDDHGLFFLGELNARFEYLDEVQFLMDIGYLFPSSGTLSHILRVADDGWIEQWPIVELSSTPQPAEWRIPKQVDASSRRRAAEAIRTLGGLTMPDDVLGTLFPGVAVPGETPQDTEPARSEVQETDTADAIAAEPPAPGEQENGNVDESTTVIEEEVQEEPTALELQTAVLHLDESLRDAFAQLQTLQEENTLLRTRLELVELPPAEQVSNLVADRNWTDRLFSAAREGRAITQRDAGGTSDDPLAASDALLAQLGRVGAPDESNDVLGRIIASQH
jgi:hypothetical protein